MDENLGIKVRQQVYFWIFVLVAFLGFVWIFADVLLPFIAGMALAYFLDPVADRLERMGASRIVATAIILFGFLVFFVPKATPCQMVYNCLEYEQRLARAWTPRATGQPPAVRCATGGD